MKQLNINITKAQITNFNVALQEDKPTVSATITLLTEGGQRIADYSISTNHYQESTKFELPVTMIPPILEIMAQLEQIVVKHCQNHQKMLESNNG